MAELAVACSVEGVPSVALAVGSCERCVGLAACAGIRLVGEAGGALTAAVAAVTVAIKHIAVVAEALIVIQSSGILARQTLVICSSRTSGAGIVAV